MSATGEDLDRRSVFEKPVFRVRGKEQILFVVFSVNRAMGC